MAEITLILGSVGLFVAAFFAWHTVWRHRAAASLERVLVSAAHSARVVRSVDDRCDTP